MIRRTQIKFVTLVMVILLFITSCVFCVFMVITKNSLKQVAEYNLDTVYDTYLKINIYGGFVSDKDYATAEKGKVYVSKYKNDFTEYADELPQKLLRSFPSSKIYSSNNIYYKIFYLVDSYYLASVDMSDTVSVANKKVVTLLIILMSSYIVIFLFIIWFSTIVFKPLGETFLKHRQFISNASHELKTPIAIISANADVIKSTEKSQWIDNIKSQTERMEKLVSDMLVLTKIDEDNLNQKPTKIDVSKEILQTVLPFEAVAYEKNKIFNIEIQNDIIKELNCEDLKKIVTILIDNAIKYSSNKGKIDVVLKNLNDKIHFIVKNDGCNVPNDKSKFIFERFYRGDESHSSDTKGSGLGLAIAKSLCQINNWKINAESKYNLYMKIEIII